MVVNQLTEAITMKAREYISKTLIAAAALTVLRVIPDFLIGQPLSGELVAWSLLSNLLVSAFFVYCIFRSTWSGVRLLAAVFFVNFVISDFNVLIEAIFFGIEISRATAVGMLATGLVATLLFTLILAALMGRLRPPAEEVDALPQRRPWPQWVWRVAVSVVAYVFLYFLAGAIIFPYVREFYQGKALPDPSQILFMQLLRGLLYVCVAIPLVRMVKARRLEAAVLAGLAFSILGGVAPLLVPNPFMPAAIRLVHGFEVGISNFLFGMIAGFMLYAKPSQPHPDQSQEDGTSQ
jgi:hypothetical protein